MRSIRWDEESRKLMIINQLALPAELRCLEVGSYTDIMEALESRAVDGASALAVCGAFALYFAASEAEMREPTALRESVCAAREQLLRLLPNAVNLRALTAGILRRAQTFEGGAQELPAFYLQQALAAAEQDLEASLSIARNGAELLHDGDEILLYGNTGALAGVDYGTAMGVVRWAYEQGKRVHVYMAETRPRLQGSKLSAWELEQYGIPYDVIVDAAAGYLLKAGKVDKVLFGAQRVAANGDVINHIGTYMLALAAYDNGVPAYAAFPLACVDFDSPSAGHASLEESDPSEVLSIRYYDSATAPESSRARNFTLDITSQRLLSGLITDRGVLYPPFFRNLTVLKQYGRDE
ncbi:MAG TPA: s-methyl-5-thioribose-1-phosphate isomerase [Anaerolineaceae bacterium]|nr:s-methyl-5-thioribose-1-phosphate isomerase [Anaerolineaceae bacterium]